MTWMDALHADLIALRRWVEGRYVPVPGPDHELVPAERYADRDYLRAAIARAGSSGAHIGAALPAADDHDDADDVRTNIAVSRFTRHYTSPLTLIAAAGLARGVGLDLSPRHCTMIVFANIPFRATLAVPDDSIVRCAERPTSWPVGGGTTVATMAELRAFVWGKLYGEHLAPLFERVHDVTRVSDRVVWTNAAEWWAMISDAAVEYLGEHEAEPFVEERRAVLGSPSLPGIAGANPLAGRIEWAPTGRATFPTEIHTRHACCLCYLIPDRLGRLCQNCGFLPFEDRVNLVGERHGVPMGAPGGPAEQTATSHGLARIPLNPKGAT